MESSLPATHEDHIASKGSASMTHYNLVHKLILMPQATKIPHAKAAVDKEWRKLEATPAWQLGKVKNNYIDGHMPPQKRGDGTLLTN